MKKLKANDDLIVGVDPSLTNTGVILLNTHGDVVHSIETRYVLKDWHKLSSKDRNSPAGQINRLYLISRTIEYEIQGVLPHKYYGMISVGYEDYSFDSLNRAFSLGELGGVLKCTLANLPARFVDFIMVSPMEVKKFALGRGDCKEKEPVMSQAALEEPCLAETTSDLCDAYFLAKFAWYSNCPAQVMKFEKDGNKNNLRLRLEMCAERMTKCK